MGLSSSKDNGNPSPTWGWAQMMRCSDREARRALNLQIDIYKMLLLNQIFYLYLFALNARSYKVHLGNV